MAKFGLTVDSDSDGDVADEDLTMDRADESVSRTASTPSPSRYGDEDETMDRSGDTRDRSDEQDSQDDEDEDEEEDEDEDDAPPMETLEDEDDVLDTDYHPPLYPISPFPSHRHTHTRSTSTSLTPDLRLRRRSDLAPEPETPIPNLNAGREWRQTHLGLEPKKVALMQRSLFAEAAEQTVPAAAGQMSSRREGWKALPGKRKVSLAELPKPSSHPSPKDSHLRPPLLRPRDFPRVPLQDSFAAGKESSLVDAGLAFGRGFRAGWGLGELVVGRGPVGDDRAVSTAPLSQLTLTKIPTLSSSKAKESAAALRLLTVQLQHTSILASSGVPSAVPSPFLRFHHFTTSFPTSDRSHESTVFRLGRALFDEIPLGLPAGLAVSEEAEKRISGVRREEAFSKWLEDVVAPSVESDVRSATNRGGGPESTFLHLTGHQLPLACDSALSSGDLRLSTLIALAGGEDPSFKTDLMQQVSLWREKRIDGHMNLSHRKIYELLSGNVSFSSGYGKPGLHVDASEQVNVAQGLDWKRCLGVHFWYQASHVNLWYAIKTYEQAFRSSRPSARAPVPWYVESPSTAAAKEANKWKVPNEEETLDAAFQMIKMSVDPTYPLETVLSPRGFGPSPFDYRLPWHLYVLFSRVLKRRDFEDREVVVGESMVEGEEEETEGKSARADRVAADYARQLEGLGMWEWSAFVLLHLESAESREAAIRDLLDRNVDSLDEKKETFLVDDLLIPPTWIASAQASLAHYRGQVFEEFKRLIEADRLDDAHSIAVAELAPEAIVHNDMTLLRRLFAGMGPESTAEWPYGGKLFIDYADLFETLPRHLGLAARGSEEAGRLADRMLDRDLPALLRDLPTLYTKRSRTPTTKQQVCTAEMMSALNTLASSVSLIRGRDYTSTVQLAHLQGADRLAYVVRSSSDAFEAALRTACEA